MPRPTLRTRIGNRKDTWCCCWPLTTCCSPPSRTVAVLPAQIWWSTVGGGGSTLGDAVCYFPQQPRLSRCPTAQAGSSGLSTVWEDSSQATCLAHLVIALTQVRHGGGLLFCLPGWGTHDDDEEEEVRAVKTITWSPMDSSPTGRMGSGQTFHCRPACSSPLSSSSPFGITHLFHLALTSSPSPISLQSDGTTAAGNFSHLSSLSSSSEWSMCMQVVLVVVVVVLHMPRVARWLTPGRSSGGSTLFIVVILSSVYFVLLLFLVSSSFSASSCFFFLG